MTSGDVLGIAIGAYVMLAFVTAAVARLTMSDKSTARAVITAPIWPVWIVVGVWLLVRRLPAFVADLWWTADWRNRNE